MEIVSDGTEQCGCKGFSKSNQGGLYYDLNHDKIHPDHFLKGQEFASLYFGSAAAAAKSLQSCPTLCDPIDRSPPGYPLPGILQARTLEWVAISSSRASSQPRD